MSAAVGTPLPSRKAKDILAASSDYLQQRGACEPRMAAELLMSRLLNCKRLELNLKSDVVLAENLLEAMRRGVKRVAAGEPVQYVLGQVDFMGHMVKVDRRALIPRPETEELVAWILECAALWGGTGGAVKSKPVIADVGTGSGCIVLSLALAKHGYYVGLDVSGDALSLAQENAAAMGLTETVAFLHGELADGVDEGTLDAVVANLPYIPTADYERLPVHIRDHEPRVALDGGADGLEVVGAVVQDAAIALKPGGHLFLEIGHDQAVRVRELLEQSGFIAIEIRKDLAGHDRMLHALSPK